MKNLGITKTTIEDYNGWTGEHLDKQIGSLYVPGATIVEIARQARTIIKAAIKDGKLLPPGTKVSVRSRLQILAHRSNVADAGLQLECNVLVD